MHISNFHFRQIYLTGWLHHTYINTSDLEVYRRIQDMPWFFVAETPEASMSLFRLAFPAARATDIPIENVALGNHDKMFQSDVDYLKSINQFDYAIYAYALNIQSERIAKMGINK